MAKTKKTKLTEKVFDKLSGHSVPIEAYDPYNAETKQENVDAKKLKKNKEVINDKILTSKNLAKEIKKNKKLGDLRNVNVKLVPVETPRTLEEWMKYFESTDKSKETTLIPVPLKITFFEHCKMFFNKTLNWTKIFIFGVIVGFILSTILFYKHQYSFNFDLNRIYKTDTIFITKYVTDTVVTDEDVKDWLYSKCGSRYDSMMASAFIYGDSFVSTPSRIMAIAYGETRLGKIILNKSSKAYGLMQILPSTARYLNLNYDSLKYDDYAIYAGAYALRKHYEYAKNNLHRGIHDYSGGGYSIQYLNYIYNVKLFDYIVKTEKLYDNWLYTIIKEEETS